MKNRLDIMVDIETLGKGNQPPVIQICAKTFDLEAGDASEKRIFERETVYSFNEIADIATLKNIEPDTLKWWLKTAPMVLSDLSAKGTESGLSEVAIIAHFVRWIEKITYDRISMSNVFLWGNGVLFDNRILKEKCEEYGLKYPVWYTNDMDMRTVMQMAALKKGLSTQHEYREMIPFEGDAHNAENDVNHQIKCVCMAYKDLVGNSND